MNEEKEEKKKFVVLKPDEKAEKLLAINNTAEKIMENMKIYEEKANGIFNSFDSDGNLITMQTLQSKIRNAQNIINDIKQISKRTDYFDSKFQQNLHEQIQKETTNMISIINQLKIEIQNGNTDLIQILQPIIEDYKEKTNKLSNFFNSNENLQNKTKKKVDNVINNISIDEIYSRIGKLTEKVNNLDQFKKQFELIKNNEKNFVNSNDIQVLRHETAEAKRTLDKMKYPLNEKQKLSTRTMKFQENDYEAIQQEIMQLNNVLGKFNNKISNLEERIESLDESNKVLKSLLPISDELSKIKKKLNEMVENNNFLSKRSKEYDPDMQMKISKLQKSVEETTKHIKNNCQNQKMQNVTLYFKQMSDDVSSSAQTITNIHNNMKQSLPKKNIAKSFVDIQKYEKKIQKRIEKKEKNIQNAQKNAPLTEQKINDLMKTIQDIKNQTNSIHDIAQKLLKINDEQTVFLSELSQEQTKCQENEAQILNLKRSCEANKNILDKGNSLTNKDRIKFLREQVNNIQIPAKSNNISATLKDFEKEMNQRLNKLERLIENKENKGIPQYPIQQIKTNVENTIKQLNKENLETRQQIYEETNASYFSVYKRINKEMDKINALVNIDENSQMQAGFDIIDDFENEIKELLRRNREQIITKDQIDKQIDSIQKSEKQFNSNVQQVKDELKKRIPTTKITNSNELIDELIKCINKLFETEKKMSIISATAVKPIHDIQRKLQSIRKQIFEADSQEIFGYPSLTTTIEADDFNIPIFNWNERPKLERVNSQEARKKLEKEVKTLKNCKNLANALKDQIYLIDDAQIKLGRLERLQDKISDNYPNIVNKTVKLPKGTQKIPQMNWKLLKYKLIQKEHQESH